MELFAFLPIFEWRQWRFADFLVPYSIFGSIAGMPINTNDAGKVWKMELFSGTFYILRQENKDK